MLVRQAQPDSAIFKALNPEWWVTPELSMLRSMEHGIRVLAWQKSKDASSGANYPDPIYLTDSERRAGGKYGTNAVPLNEMADFLGWEN